MAMTMQMIEDKAIRLRRNIILRAPSTKGKKGNSDYFYRVTSAAVLEAFKDPDAFKSRGKPRPATAPLVISINIDGIRTEWLRLSTAINKSTYNAAFTRATSWAGIGGHETFYQLVEQFGSECAGHLPWAEPLAALIRPNQHDGDPSDSSSSSDEEEADGDLSALNSLVGDSDDDAAVTIIEPPSKLAHPSSPVVSDEAVDEPAAPARMSTPPRQPLSPRIAAAVEALEPPRTDSPRAATPVGRPKSPAEPPAPLPDATTPIRPISPPRSPPPPTMYAPAPGAPADSPEQQRRDMDDYQAQRRTEMAAALEQDDLMVRLSSDDGLVAHIGGTPVVTDDIIPADPVPATQLMLDRPQRMGRLLAELQNVRATKMRHINQLDDGKPPVIPVIRSLQCPSLHRHIDGRLAIKLDGIIKGAAFACSRAVIAAEETVETAILVEIRHLYENEGPWSPEELAAARAIRDSRASRIQPYRSVQKGVAISFVAPITADSLQIEPHNDVKTTHSTADRIAGKKKVPVIAPRPAEQLTTTTKKKKATRGGQRRNTPTAAKNGQRPLPASGRQVPQSVGLNQQTVAQLPAIVQPTPAVGPSPEADNTTAQSTQQQIPATLPVPSRRLNVAPIPANPPVPSGSNWRQRPAQQTRAAPAAAAPSRTETRVQRAGSEPPSSTRRAAAVPVRRQQLSTHRSDAEIKLRLQARHRGRKGGEEAWPARPAGPQAVPPGPMPSSSSGAPGWQANLPALVQHYQQQQQAYRMALLGNRPSGQPTGGFDATRMPPAVARRF